jgi:pimeloyl-ACP methyl ester carboxylesterase
VQTFNSDGVRIAFLDEGQGEPILLIHGFASSVRFNWIDPGWVGLLTRNGFRVIAVDNRGHGESEKLYDEAAYGAPLMAEDARRLLDHLGIEQADVMGYSMGARITAFLALAHPGRVRSAMFGGLGGNMLRPMQGTDKIAEALEAPSLDDVTDAYARTFRAFADRTGSARRLHPLGPRALDRRYGGPHRLPRAGGNRHRGRGRGLGRGTGGRHPWRRGIAHSAARPHAGCRRPRLQGRRARLPAPPALMETTP